MNVKLTPEQEQLVKDELKAGNFRSAEEVIGRALQVLRQHPAASGNASRISLAQKSAVDEMIAFIEKNRVRLKDVSVKELIHEGHRL